MKEQIKIWLDYFEKKLIRPMSRSYTNPNYLARSCAVGMGLAFSPFPGQMPVVLAIWVVARKFKWRFSLMISLAWTFISNVFTNLPLFYLYYRTGDYLRGGSEVLSYQGLKMMFTDGFWLGLKGMATELGCDILLGSFLFMIIFAFVGYFLGYYLATRHKKIPLD